MSEVLKEFVEGNMPTLKRILGVLDEEYSRHNDDVRFHMPLRGDAVDEGNLPLMRTDLRGCGHIDGALDISMELVYNYRNIGRAGSKDDVSGFKRFELSGLPLPLMLTSIRNFERRLRGHLKDFERDYGACMEIIDRKYPWLAGACVLARHLVQTEFLHEGQHLESWIWALDASWVHIPSIHKAMNPLFVTFRPKYDIKTMEVSDVFMDDVKFGMCGEELLIGITRDWMLRERLEAL